MRLVADTPEEYKQLSRVQKILNAQFKQEKEKDATSTMTTTLRKVIATSIEKSYERPGESSKVANNSMQMETDDSSLFVSYIVHAALSRLKTAIEYRTLKGDVSTRLIEPFAWRGDSVVAWCHERGAWRQFKPKQIVRVAVTNEAFDRDEDVDIVADDAKTMNFLVTS